MTEEKLFLELAEKFHAVALRLAEMEENVVSMLELIHRELVEIREAVTESEP